MGVTLPIDGRSQDSAKRFAENARRAAGFLKTLANDRRLMILCYLAEGEHSVGELEKALDIRQPTLSQQLAILREEGLVETRRDGKSIYYNLTSTEAETVIELLYEIFCKDEPSGAGTRKRTELAAGTPPGE